MTSGWKRIVALVAIACSAVAAAWLLHHYIPFHPASYLFWASVFTVAAGLLALIHPPRSIGICTRQRALIIVFTAILVAALSLLWPYSAMTSTRQPAAIDEFIPQFHWNEFHSMAIEATAPRVFQAIENATFSDIAGFAPLMKLRRLAGGDFSPYRPPKTVPVLDAMTRPGGNFFWLKRVQGEELVLGMAGKPWSNAPPPGVKTPGDFGAFAEPGAVKIAFNLRVVPQPGGKSLLTTETRICAVDENARKLFSRYWTAIYPGSAIIRRMFLEGIAERARH